MKMKFITARSSKVNKKPIIPLRLNILFFVIFILFSILILRLGIIQIINGESYQRELRKVKNMYIYKNVPRGMILDTNYNVLVGNKGKNAITYIKSHQTTSKEIFAVAQALEEMVAIKIEKVPEATLKEVWLLQHEKESLARLTREEKKLRPELLYKRQLKRVTVADIKALTKHDRQVAVLYHKMAAGSALTELLIKSKGVSSKEISIVSEHLDQLPGVDITVDWDRYYTYEKTLRSILGKVTTEKEGLPKEKLAYFLAQGYNRNDRVGKSYLESVYENILSGQKGVFESVIDKKGNVIHTTQKSMGQKGKDIVLSIDIDLQHRIEKIIQQNLKTGKAFAGSDLLDRAFVVVMEPRSGRILSLAGQRINEENQFEDFALGTFTTSYTMGSAVKGATELAGMMNGSIDSDTYLTDKPIKFKGTVAKSSWFNRTGEKSLYLSPSKALEISSNSYMYQVALKMAGVEYVYNGTLQASLTTFDKMRFYYHQFGLGIKTGINLPGEQIGVKGNDQIAGQILDFAIGQYDSYTPLQMAQYVSTVANGGYRIQPNLVKEIREPSLSGNKMGAVAHELKPVILNKLSATERQINEVQTGFYQVTHGIDGTAAKFFKSAPYTVAGKTGTADAFYDGPKAGNKMANVWNTTFVGYAPAKNPEIAIAVIVPWQYRNANGYKDSKINLSISREVLDSYFAKKKKTKQSSETKFNNLKKMKQAQAE